jgi:hypothetical protein
MNDRRYNRLGRRVVVHLSYSLIMRIRVRNWPIATNFSLAPDVSFWGEADLGRAAEFAALVENDPEQKCGASLR